jgi:hypothetical protein
MEGRKMVPQNTTFFSLFIAADTQSLLSHYYVSILCYSISLRDKLSNMVRSERLGLRVMAELVQDVFDNVTKQRRSDR